MRMQEFLRGRETQVHTICITGSQVREIEHGPRTVVLRIFDLRMEGSVVKYGCPIDSRRDKEWSSWPTFMPLEIKGRWMTTEDHRYNWWEYGLV